MTESQQAGQAWQPLTLRGVAAFARASVGRLLLVQLIVALVAGGLVIWFLHRAWFPTISQAIRHLPPQGELRSGRLEWTGDSPVRLAEGRFLAITVDLNHSGTGRSPAHVQVEFGRQDLKVLSLFGELRWRYPPGESVPFNQPELGPWWGAWAPALLAVAGLLVVVGLMASWACLATLYLLPVWLVSFFADRTCSLGGSWRLSGAALMPGALLICAAVLLYGLGALDLVRLTVVGAVHFVVGWVYLIASPFWLPPWKGLSTARDNPFA